MESKEFVAAFDRDSEAFADACEAAGLGTAVRSCPGWTVADLLWHLTEVQDFWRTIVGGERVDPDGYKVPQRPADDALLDMYRTGRPELLKTLTEADPTAPNWTWSNDKTAGFVIRRMAQETAMHLWDATDASGSAQPIEANLASDGIDEFLIHMLPDGAKGAAAVRGSVHLHCGDVAGEWTITEAGEGFAVKPEHAKGDCAIRGTASNILLALWRRVPMSACDVLGDADVAARFIAHTNLN